MSAHDRNISYHIPAAGSRSTIRISMDDSVFRSENRDYYSHQQAPRHHAGCCSALARLAAAPNPTRIQRNTVLRNGHIPSASKQNKASRGTHRIRTRCRSQNRKGHRFRAHSFAQPLAAAPAQSVRQVPVPPPQIRTPCSHSYPPPNSLFAPHIRFVNSRVAAATEAARAFDSSPSDLFAACSAGNHRRSSGGHLELGLAPARSADSSCPRLFRGGRPWARHVGYQGHPSPSMIRTSGA